MNYNNEATISPHWPAFSRLWKIVAILLFLLLVLLWFLQASPWSKNGGVCAPKVPAPVEKIVEEEKIVEAPLADTLAPILNLNGDSAVHVPVGTSYADAGAAAMDNVDGEASVIVTGEVDYNTPGEYVLTYTATDKAGNTSSTTRTVIVDAKEVVAVLPTSAKLYFANNSAVSPNDPDSTLAKVIAYLKANSGSKAVVSGFHSAVGNFDLNQELSKQRAATVSQMLQASGITADRIVQEKPVETTGSGTAAQARRVEVSIGK